MVICGQEFEFSLMNANDLDRFEDANERMQRRSAEESEQFRRGGVRLGDHARAQAKKDKHNPPVSYPAPPASRMVERVDAQVSAKQKTEQLIDARQAMNALRDDPDAMQQLAAYALQIAAERHV